MFDGQALSDYEMLQIAKRWKKDLGQVSVPFLQRKLRIDYYTALYLIEELTNKQVN